MIRFLVTEVLLHIAVGNLTRLDKMRDWALLNAVLLLPFFARAVVLDSKISEMDILNIFAANIAERRSESAAKTSERKEKYKDELG